MNDSELNAVTLLYLSKSWDGGNSLLDCAHKFQQTKAELIEALRENNGLVKAILDGSYSM